MATKHVSLGQITDYEIKHLRVFKAVVDCGGFSSAETTLNISRPTISLHIANLETRLNLTLCKRGRAGFALTEEGTIVYEQAKKLLESIEGFRNVVNNISTQPTGRLKVGLSDALSLDPRCRLPQIIQQFCQQAPGVELCTSVEHMSELERRVLNGELDFGFIPYHRRLEGLTYIHLFTDNNYLYCGRENPLYHLADAEITEAMIRSARLVHAGLKPHEEVYQKLSSMNLAGISYYYESRIAMALSGQFICFLPEAVAQPYVEQGELKAIATHSQSFPLGVAVIGKKAISHNRAKELFFDAIRAVFADASEVAPY
ncbi:MAG TPA: LysR family transcriptional regulator [Motiliproteus sp.]